MKTCFRCGNTNQAELIDEPQQDSVRGDYWSQPACENRTACRLRREPLERQRYVLGRLATLIQSSIPRLEAELSAAVKERDTLLKEKASWPIDQNESFE